MNLTTPIFLADILRVSDQVKESCTDAWFETRTTEKVTFVMKKALAFVDVVVTFNHYTNIIPLLAPYEGALIILRVITFAYGILLVANNRNSTFSTKESEKKFKQFMLLNFCMIIHSSMKFESQTADDRLTRGLCGILSVALLFTDSLLRISTIFPSQSNFIANKALNIWNQIFRNDTTTENSQQSKLVFKYKRLDATIFENACTILSVTPDQLKDMDEVFEIYLKWRQFSVNRLSKQRANCAARTQMLIDDYDIAYQTLLAHSKK